MIEGMDGGAPPPVNIGRRRHEQFGPDTHWLDRSWHDGPGEDAEWPDVQLYTDAMSYAPGSEIAFHVSTHAPTWTLRIFREGQVPRPVHEAAGLPGGYASTPGDSFRSGCSWPVLHRWRIPADCRSGFFSIEASCARSNGSIFVQRQFFVVRPGAGTRARHLLVLPTATWTAYNDWGGGNHYAGAHGPEPVLSLVRPWRNGLVWLPEDTPRVVSDRHRPLGSPPQYQLKGWSLAHGYGQFAGAAGWAQFDRHFIRWAERNGYAIDMITQTDLHYRPHLIEGYDCLVFVGHDEYWSREMRDVVDDYVETGGNVARFAGNFLWQIRLEDEGRKQICYKYHAAQSDPVAGTAEAHRLTSAWEDQRVGHPGASTFGVNALRGMYASWGGFCPAGTRGFTVYRPDHWAFEGCGIRFGDLLGDRSEVFAYEVDGLEYGFRHGLPFPTGADGAPEGLQILAMSPATMAEDRIEGDPSRYYIGDADLRFAAEAIEGSSSAEAMEKRRRGSGMIVSFAKGRGQVFTAGTCEWVMGLARADRQVEQVTANVLNRFACS